MSLSISLSLSCSIPRSGKKEAKSNAPSYIPYNKEQEENSAFHKDVRDRGPEGPLGHPP